MVCTVEDSIFYALECWCVAPRDRSHFHRHHRRRQPLLRLQRRRRNHLRHQRQHHHLLHCCPLTRRVRPCGGRVSLTPIYRCHQEPLPPICRHHPTQDRTLRIGERCFRTISHRTRNCPKRPPLSRLRESRLADEKRRAKARTMARMAGRNPPSKRRQSRRPPSRRNRLRCYQARRRPLLPSVRQNAAILRAKASASWPRTEAPLLQTRGWVGSSTRRSSPPRRRAS